MNKTVELFKGCYTIESYCDICLNKIEHYRIYKCSFCKKYLCEDCQFEINKNGDIIKVDWDSWFDVFCLDHVNE